MIKKLRSIFFTPTPEHSSEDFISCRGNKIFFKEICPENFDQTPVVLLHGFPDHHGNLIRIFDGLGEHWRILAYDRTGSGLSDKPSEPTYDLDYFVDELRELMRQRNIPKIIVLGHSIGGTLAVQFAAKYPECCEAVIFVNPALKDFKIQTGLNYFGAWCVRLPLIGEISMMFHPRYMTAECLKLAFMDHGKISKSLVESYHFPFCMPGAKQSYLKCMRNIYGLSDQHIQDKMVALKQNNIPSLFIWTEKDWSMPIEDGEYFSESVGGQLVRIPECGHSPHLELEPARFKNDVIQPILNFLAKLNYASSSNHSKKNKLA